MLEQIMNKHKNEIGLTTVEAIMLVASDTNFAKVAVWNKQMCMPENDVDDLIYVLAVMKEAHRLSDTYEPFSTFLGRKLKSLLPVVEVEEYDFNGC